MKKLKIGTNESIYIFIISLLYLVYGVLQFYNGMTGWVSHLGGTLQIGVPVLGTYIPFVFPSIFSGLALFTVGALLLKGVYMWHQGDKKYRGYVFVGWAMAMLLMALNILVMVADILDTYYPLVWGGEVEEGWSLAGDAWGIAPHLVFGLLLVPFYPKMKGFLEELSPMKYSLPKGVEE